MINHGKDVKIFACNANPNLAAKIAKELDLKVGNAEVSMFSDGEISVNIYETVRGSDVFIVQSTSNPVNDNLMELLIMIDAFKRASASRITAVMPYFGYARQDRKSKARDPISAKLVADLITAAGADRVLTMDLHAAQIQGFFNIPVDHLLGGTYLAQYYLEKFPQRSDLVVVSPDLGSVTSCSFCVAAVVIVQQEADVIKTSFFYIQRIGKIHAGMEHGIVVGFAVYLILVTPNLVAKPPALVVNISGFIFPCAKARNAAWR